MIIAVDGVYSAGKTTLIRAAAEYLSTQARAPIAVTEWNSSVLLGSQIPGWKRDSEMGGHSLLLVEAADLAHRCEQTILPHLAAGGVVVADRWVLSGMARSVIRGVNRQFADCVFDFAPREDVTILIECPAELTLARRKAIGKRIGGYHSGRDYRRTASAEADFVRYQTEMQHLYRELAERRGAVVTISTEQPEADCIEQLIKGVTPYLSSASADPSVVPWTQPIRGRGE